ncbi:hypothetical protein LCGC14_1719100 [marine sediment metagenome]|uniref:Uncharacterized protein n=1 Tax=marine sediment metagenome TaxID=412755 RepID=A0A0F9HCR5_9ZZZZ
MKYKVHIEVEIEVDQCNIDGNTNESDEENIAFNYEVMVEDTAEMAYGGKTLAYHAKVTKDE